MPKIKNKILATFLGGLYDMQIECVDENSIDKQNDKKWRMWVESQGETISFFKAMAEQAGAPYKLPDKLVNTPEELELHEANGGFKLNYAKEGEKIIKDGWNISNGDEIDEKVLDDLIDLNIAGYRVYYDKEVGKEMIRWIDPQFAGVQKSKHNDYRDSSYAYEIEFIPAHKLVSMGIPIEEIPAIAHRYETMWGNPAWDDAYNSTERAELACGFFKVPVLDVEWVDIDTMKRVKYRTKFGTERVRDYVEGERLAASKQYVETKIHRVYQAKWIIDTDIVYDWGLKPNQPRREKNQALLSFHFIGGKTAQSLTEQLIPVLDDFQLTWLKYQDAKGSAVKSGYALEWEALNGMKLGGGRADPLDIVKLWRTTGILYYSRRNRHGSATSSKPVEQMPNGMGTAIVELVQALDTNARLVEEITGINPVSLGATADPNAGKAVTEMSVANSAAPIKNIFDKLFQLKGHTSLDLLMRAQLDMRNSEGVRNRYRSVIGEMGVKTLVEAEGQGVRFGCKLIAKPTQEERQVILQYVQQSLQNGRDGKPGLNVPDALYVTRQLSSGANLREIEAWIDFRIRQSAAEQQQAAAAAAQQQIEGGQQLEAMKEQSVRIAAQIKTESEAMLAELKHKFDMELEMLKAENEMKIKRMEAAIAPPTPAGK